MYHAIIKHQGFYEYKKNIESVCIPCILYALLLNNVLMHQAQILPPIVAGYNSVMLVEHQTAEWEVTGSSPGRTTKSRVLK